MAVLGFTLAIQVVAHERRTEKYGGRPMGPLNTGMLVTGDQRCVLF